MLQNSTALRHANTGFGCWYHTVRVGVVVEPADGLWFHRRAAATGFELKSMTPNQMRNAANAVNWILKSNSQGYGAMKEVLRNHIDVEARVHLGSRGSSRVQEDATLLQGSVPKGTMFLIEYSMCNVALDGHPERAS
jgi:hypothetical protein